MNLATALLQSAAAHPERPAILWGTEQWTHRRLTEEAAALAEHLQTQLGVAPGDRVAIWLKNRPEFIIALFGVLFARAAVVPINNFLKPPEVAYMLRDAGVRVLITDASMNEGLPQLESSQPGLKVLLAEDFAGLKAKSSGRIPAVGSTESDLAVIIYTSGTTGKPKGAMLSHGNLLSNVESCRQRLQATESDRFIVLLPLFHSFMLCVGTMLPLLSGGSMLLVKSLHPVKNVLAEIIEHGGTVLPAIPQFFRALAAMPDLPALPLRLCISGAAPLPREILKEFHDRVRVPLREGYGLSEASPVVSNNPIDDTWKVGSIGLPLPGVEVLIKDDQGQTLPTGEQGELWVRGGNVMLGYWNQPEETAKSLRDGWLLTGDIGYQDADGFLFITDRKKDMLLVNGINVYPREIEEVLYQFPGIKEAAVIGIPDARKGEQPLAFLAADAGTTIDEKAVLQFLRSRLADYKVPRRVHLLAALPRNATGKILKTELRQLAVEPQRES